MGAGTSWILSIAIALAIGIAATLYFRTVVMRRDETDAGIVALSAMSWREFIHLVLDALSARGYSRVFDRAAPSGDDDYVLERDGRHWLLTCKHGSAFVLGNAAVVELASGIRLANAAGGILATQGRISPDVRPAAALQKIELLDGPTLWPELRELLPPAQIAAIRAVAATRARQRVLLSWLLALVAGLAVFLLVRATSDGDGAVVATTAPASRTAAGATPEASKPATAKPMVIAAPAGNDAAAMEAQRLAAAEAIATLPMVGRAIWTTHSTLEVFLIDADGDAFAGICPILVRYDALAASRVQLNPPEGSGQPVRFRQCRQY